MMLLWYLDCYLETGVACCLSVFIVDFQCFIYVLADSFLRFSDFFKIQMFFFLVQAYPIVPGMGTS